MPEAYALPNQVVGEQRVSVLDAAEALEIALMGSATLFQGKLTQGLPEFVGRTLGTATDAESAIQFSRSAPGMTTSLIGMGKAEHVRINLQVANKELVTQEIWRNLFNQRR